MPTKHITIPSVSFIGPMASGKSTYADGLKAALEHEFPHSMIHRQSISKVIRGIADELFPDSRMDRRKLYQLIGNAMQEIDPKVWGKYIVRDANKKGGSFIIDNIRRKTDQITLTEAFPNLITIRIDTDHKRRLEAYKKQYGRFPSNDESNDKTERTIHHLPHDARIFNDYAPATMTAFSRSMVESIKEGKLQEFLKHLRKE
jgi:adenylate kinase family enzyme